MDLLISMVVYVIFFAIVAYGGSWIITKYSLPQPVNWLFGGALLIALLVLIAMAIKGTLPVFHITG